MKTKEEVIKEAWKKSWKGYDGSILENGWSKVICSISDEDCEIFDVIPRSQGYLIRPKSLRGIENNNGWLSLPKNFSKIEYRGDIWIITKHGEIELIREEDFIPFGYATHFQPIVKPNKPLY